MTDQSIIETEHISKRFGGVVALDDVSIQIQKGELHAICGENGAGKSTLMKILCGQHTDFEGVIRLRGESIRFSGIKDAENQGISIIHQELNLVEELSVAANIFLGREISSAGFLSNRQMNQKARELLSRLECEISPATIAGSLRIGDQQLIEIAKALSLGAEILIMDEPTSALTEAEVARLDRVIEDVRKSGVTILYISHKMDEIFRLSDRITVLRDGRLIETVETSDSSASEITRLMVGRELAEQSRRPEKQAGSEAILKINRLSRRWPGHARQWRLQEIDLELYPGEIVGIAGLMGAGRTELLECIYGCCDDPTEGQIVLDGKTVEIKHPEQAIKLGISMVTEDRKRLGLFNNLNIRENITVCSLNEFGAHNFVSGRQELKACDSTIDSLKIKLSNHRAAIGSLSGGNQQKCVIGRSLLTKPKVLLLDDPTRGVDVGAKAEIYKLLDELSKQGIAILMSSSELPELLLVCDRIVVLCEGRITGNFDREGLTEHQIMEAATAAN